MQKAMVVDDSKAMRLILGRILTTLGYEVLQAVNGIDALAVLAANSKDVAIALVDWNMPEMSGIEFVRAARVNKAYTHIPIMMVTTETQHEQIFEALNAGANEYVMKPFTEEVLLEKIPMAFASLEASAGTAADLIAS